MTHMRPPQERVAGRSPYSQGASSTMQVQLAPSADFHTSRGPVVVGENQPPRIHR